MKYIDIHCHLNLPEFNMDMNDAIQRAKDKDVGMIVVGINYATSKKAIEIAEQNENIWAIIGLHPVEVPCEQFDYDAYKKLAEHKKVVGIGECGLDYYRNTFESKNEQEKVFIKHIELANELGKPIMLHLRSGMKKEQNAYTDAIEILKKHAKVHGDVHFYAGNEDEAKQFIDLNFRLSFTGVITFVRDFDEIIRNTPLDMIMSETDAPYVAPEPYRGTRNEPVYVIEIAHKIAEIKGLDREDVKNTIVQNAKVLFNL